MIAAPPQKPPSIRERYLAFVEHMKSVPDRMLESIASQCHCPHCGDALPLRWARWTERWQVYHPLTWCELRGETWYGDTREEAIAEFQRFAAPVGFHSDQGRSLPDTQKKAATGAAIPPAKEPLQLLPVSGGIPSESPELDKKNEAAVSATFQPLSATVPPEQSGSPSLTKIQGRTFGPLGNAPGKIESTDSATPGPKAGATFQGMEFSAEGLDDEAVNALLTMKED